MTFGTLIRAVELMSTRERQVFTLRKVYCYTTPQVAECLHITESEVEDWLAKAARVVDLL